MKRNSKAKRAKTSKARAKRAAGGVRTRLGVNRSKPVRKAATGVRAQASRRTADGKFTKIVFNKIGGRECPRFAAMTWSERDVFMSKPENAAVRERYEKHLASVESGE